MQLESLNQEQLEDIKQLNHGYVVYDGKLAHIYKGSPGIIKNGVGESSSPKEISLYLLSEVMSVRKHPQIEILIDRFAKQVVLPSQEFLTIERIAIKTWVIHQEESLHENGEGDEGEHFELVSMVASQILSDFMPENGTPQNVRMMDLFPEKQVLPVEEISNSSMADEAKFFEELNREKQLLDERSRLAEAARGGARAEAAKNIRAMKADGMTVERIAKILKKEVQEVEELLNYSGEDED